MVKRSKKRRERSRVESYNADEFKGVSFEEEPSCSNHEDNVHIVGPPLSPPRY